MRLSGVAPFYGLSVIHFSVVLLIVECGLSGNAPRLLSGEWDNTASASWDHTARLWPLPKP